MRRNRTLVGLAIVLAALLFLPGSPSDVDGQGSTSAFTDRLSAAAQPVLPRDFALPVPLFAPDSAWNQAATRAGVLPESDQQVLVTYRVLHGDTTSLHPAGPADWYPVMWVNFDEWTMPIFRAGSGQLDVLICDYEGNLGWPHPKFGIHQEGGPVRVAAPVGTVRPSSPQGAFSDGHLVLYDPGTFTAYDFWQATTQRDGPCQSRGGGLTGPVILEAGTVDFFNTRGLGANPSTWYSARAVGTPLLAGLLLPEDVESGAISHALAFAIPGLRNRSTDPYEPLASDYFYPASTTETDFYNTNPNSLAAGQRIRLKPTVVDNAGNPINEDQLAPITRMFLTGLRTYGAYLVDNAGGFSFYAEEITTAVLNLSDAQVNVLIGESAGAPLPANKTKWQLVMEKLNAELDMIPFAYGPPIGNPATATIDRANFEVVEPADIPMGAMATPTMTPTATSQVPSTPSRPVHLPLVRRDYAPSTLPVATPPATPSPPATPTPSITPSPLCSDPQPPFVTDLQVRQAPVLPEPTPRASFRDPVFGTCLVRVTDRTSDLAPDDPSTGLKNEYSRVQSFNADESRILVRSIEAEWYLYDAVTLQPLDQLPLDAEPRWDASDPNLIYYSQQTRLMRYNLQTESQTLVHDFAADFPGQSVVAVWMRYEGSPSGDSRYWGLMAQDEEWNSVAFVVYDRQTDQVTIRDLRSVPGVEDGIDSVTISPLGNYFLAYFDRYCQHGQLGTDTQPCGLMVYDHNLTNGRGRLRIVGHSDLALDARGREVLIYQDIDTDDISMLDLATGAVTALWPIDFDHTAIGFHFSGRGFNRPGWALVSTYNGGHPTAYTWMDDQVFAVELKANGRVVRLAHTRSQYDETQEQDYWAEPHASVNRDFTRFVFTTNWGRSGTGQVEMYLGELPADWPAQLP